MAPSLIDVFYGADSGLKSFKSAKEHQSVSSYLTRREVNPPVSDESEVSSSSGDEEKVFSDEEKLFSDHSPRISSTAL